MDMAAALSSPTALTGPRGAGSLKCREQETRIQPMSY
jgi:hypothetical protein